MVVGRGGTAARGCVGGEARGSGGRGIRRVSWNGVSRSAPELEPRESGWRGLSRSGVGCYGVSEGGGGVPGLDTGRCNGVGVVGVWPGGVPRGVVGWGVEGSHGEGYRGVWWGGVSRAGFRGGVTGRGG